MDQFRRPGVYIDGFNCAAATVTCTLGRTLNFTATICEGKADGNVLTAKAIMHLGQDMQEKIFKNPTAKDIKVTFNDGIGGTLIYALTLTSCDIVSSPSGGLKLEISATTEDILCDAFDPSLYSKCINTQELLKVTTNEKTSMQIDQFWVCQLKDFGSPSTPLTKKINRLLSNTKNKYNPSLDGQSSGSKQALESQRSINDKIYADYVEPFLIANLDSTDVLNKQVPMTNNLNRAIFNGLATIMFNSSGGFLNKIINLVCPEFLLWYVPDHKTGKMGKLKNQNYVMPKKPKKLYVPISGVKMSLGRSLGNSLPPVMCSVQTQVDYGTLSSTTGKKEFKFLVSSYPDTAEDRLGVVYNLSAPKWFFVTFDDEQSVASKENPLNKPRTPEGVKAERKKNNQMVTKNKKTFSTALKYLAEHAFNKLKYSTSVAGITCPFQAKLDVEIGDFVTLCATEGGTILTGILTSVTHSVQAQGGMVTNLGFARVEIA